MLPVHVPLRSDLGTRAKRRMYRYGLRLRFLRCLSFETSWVINGRASKNGGGGGGGTRGIAIREELESSTYLGTYLLILLRSRAPGQQVYLPHMLPVRSTWMDFFHSIPFLPDAVLAGCENALHGTRAQRTCRLALFRKMHSHCWLVSMLFHIITNSSA
jgi:hypothetical protein